MYRMYQNVSRSFDSWSAVIAADADGLKSLIYQGSENSRFRVVLSSVNRTRLDPKNAISKIQPIFVIFVMTL